MTGTANKRTPQRLSAFRASCKWKQHVFKMLNGILRGKLPIGKKVALTHYIAPQIRHTCNNFCNSPILYHPAV